MNYSLVFSPVKWVEWDSIYQQSIRVALINISKGLSDRIWPAWPLLWTSFPSFLICRCERRHAGDPGSQGRGPPRDGGTGTTCWKGKSYVWKWESGDHISEDLGWPRSLCPICPQVGLLLRRDRAQSHAMVQLGRENQVVELHYDAICQYMGPGDSDEDWHMDHCPSLRLSLLLLQFITCQRKMGNNCLRCKDGDVTR